MDDRPGDERSADDPPSEGETDARRTGFGCVLEVIETVALTLLLFFVIQGFVAQPFQVQQHSMEGTFVEGDYVLVDRLTHLWSPYSHGQIVVFQAPPSTSLHEPLIKRVIGVAGDTVEVREGRVFVNGIALDEPYLFKGADGVAQATIASEESRWIVPDGDLFVMGDHRQVSEDSRVFGPIPVSTIIGRAAIRYWPLSQLGIIATPTSGDPAVP